MQEYKTVGATIPKVVLNANQVVNFEINEPTSSTGAKWFFDESSECKNVLFKNSYVD
jgi:hypothetical protein